METFYTSSQSTHNKQQAGIKSICTEERGEKVWQLQICVQILVENVIVPVVHLLFCQLNMEADRARKEGSISASFKMLEGSIDYKIGRRLKL